MLSAGRASLCFALLALSSVPAASAQLAAAKDGPVVYGHHHLNVTKIDEHKNFWLEGMGITLDRPYTKIAALNIAIAFISDPWGTYIELTEGLDKVS